MYDLEDVMMKSFRDDNGISSAFSIEPVDDNEYGFLLMLSMG